MYRFAPILLGTLFVSLQAMAEAPRLVLQITIDGFRADLLERYSANFGEGGFRYLLNNGALYTNAHYQHANTETIVGHTTLATGATPAVHGMVGNVWYHAATGELGYNIEDAEAPLLPTRSEAAEGAQVDPAQLRAGSKGRSPRAILVPTFSDTLSISGDGGAKVFGVSGKDRSAVAMAGKTGTAYWYSTDTGDFQTSAYYMDAYPRWVQDWNGKRAAEQHAGAEWTLLLDQERYLLGKQDNRAYEIDLKGYGRVFPHAFGAATHPLFFTRVLVSPFSDVLLADFAKALVNAEEIGIDDTTDYLSVSFSGVDAVNHFFGPSSLENEDTVLRLDRTLADFLAFIDEGVGLDNTLIVLSADHGMAEMPEYATEKGLTARRIYSDDILAAAKAFSEQRFGSAALVKDFYRPYFYLDEVEIAGADLDRDTVIREIAAAVESIEGVFTAVPAAEALSYGETAVAHNHHPQRSGHIYVYPDAHGFLFDRGAIGVMHGSPWSYDTQVPILFSGPGITPGRIARPVHPVDVAPTLSAFLKLPIPAGAQGTPLREVLPTR